MAEMVSDRPGRSLPLLSLFCGPGGLDLGFERAGFSPLLALDIDQSAVDTYNNNRSGQGSPAKRADLADTDPATIMEWWEQKAGPGVAPIGIIGGPACQAFSISNVHKKKDDPRARLPFHYARIVRAFNEKFDLDFFLFENVAGLGRRSHAKTLSAIKAQLTKAGFYVMTFYLDAVRFGVAQYRNRFFILGLNRSKFSPTFEPPAGDDRLISVRKAIAHLPEPIYFSRPRKAIDGGIHVNHWCMNPRSKKFTNGKLLATADSGRSFRVLEWQLPSRTVAYGHREVHVHPNRKRRLSVYEAMLLQGFPPSYELSGTLSDQIRLVSDAVPPPLAYSLALAILTFLDVSNAYEQPANNGHVEHAGLVGRHTSAPKSTKP